MKPQALFLKIFLKIISQMILPVQTDVSKNLLL